MHKLFDSASFSHDDLMQNSIWVGLLNSTCVCVCGSHLAVTFLIIISIIVIRLMLVLVVWLVERYKYNCLQWFFYILFFPLIYTIS